MNTQNLSLDPCDQQKQAYQCFLEADYLKATQIYEQIIAAAPDIKFPYWYLGLILLLEGQEVDAQTTWLIAMAEGEPEEIEQWTEELIQVLDTEAERQRLQTGDYEKAWIIRQYIREIQPAAINNLLHLIGLSTLRQTYTETELQELGILDLLNSQVPIEIDCELLFQVLTNVLDQAAFSASSYDLAEACIPYVENPTDFIDTLIPVIYKLAYCSNQDRLALRLTQIGLKANPKHPELMRCLANIYQDLQDYTKGIEAAKNCYAEMDSLAEKVYANFLLMRGLMDAGGYWYELCSVIDRHKSLIADLVEENPLSLKGDTAVRLFCSTFVFPYFQDHPEENLRLRCKVAQLAQFNVENNNQETVNRCRQWQSRSDNQTTKKRLKIGYLSHCLRHHSVGWLARGLFQYHDHEQFEIYSYLFAAEVRTSPLQNWYMSRSDKVCKLALDGIEAAEKISEDEIDILVDLDSLTLTTACETIAIKPAPIQITWLGWDASAVPSIDYFIADPYVLPEDAQKDYQETIWRLPQSYIAVDGFEVGVPTLRREQLNIPNDTIIYFTAQRGYKYNLHTAQLQVKILKAVPNSYFIIKGVADRNLLQNFYAEIAEAEGVNCDRLKILPSVATEEMHRANLAIADVILDTYPYNGATTTMETLWMGIPMVTRVGQQFSARNSYTMMINAGITEGIAWTDEEYVEWGIKLGTDENLRQQISWKLRKNRQTAPLWNAKQFTREMENAYQQIWKKYIEAQN